MNRLLEEVEPGKVQGIMVNRILKAQEGQG